MAFNQTAPDPVVTDILLATSDQRVREAMLLGSSYEGGWGPTYGVGDQGTSFGPFQIHLPAHPGVTAAQASDPQWATQYMLGTYEGAVGSVPQSLWSADPALAAEEAAVAAERPAKSYLQSYGQQTLDQHWNNVLTALQGGTGGAITSSQSLAQASAGGSNTDMAGTLYDQTTQGGSASGNQQAPDNWASFDAQLATSGLPNIDKMLVALHALLNPPMAKVNAPHVHWYDLIPIVGAVDIGTQAAKDATNVGEDIASVLAMIFVRGLIAALGFGLLGLGILMIIRKPAMAALGAATSVSGGVTRLATRNPIVAARRSTAQADARTARTQRQAAAEQRANTRLGLAVQRVQTSTHSAEARTALSERRASTAEHRAATVRLGEERRQREQEMRIPVRPRGRHFQRGTSSRPRETVSQ